MSLHREFRLQPMTGPGDPDDRGPGSSWALVGEPAAHVAVMVAGHAIPLHRRRIDGVRGSGA